jgi:hypothetical protein
VTFYSVVSKLHVPAVFSGRQTPKYSAFISCPTMFFSENPRYWFAVFCFFG